MLHCTNRYVKKKKKAGNKSQNLLFYSAKQEKGMAFMIHLCAQYKNLLVTYSSVVTYTFLG